MHKLSLLLLIILELTCLEARASSFFKERYRGWYWFDERNKRETIKEQQIDNVDSPIEAKEEVESFKQELDNVRYVMIANPTVENIKNYRAKESEMWQKAEKLHEAWDLANLLYPEQRDLINNPVNVHAVKAKREIERSRNEYKIRELAKEYELVLFFDSHCRYCELFAPVLKAFGEKYNFKINAISNDGSNHQYFNTAYHPELIEKLGISAFPTVIAISNDASTAFELIRGYVSISELEDYSLLAAQYLQAAEENHLSKRLTK